MLFQKALQPIVGQLHANLSITPFWPMQAKDENKSPSKTLSPYLQVS